MPLVDRAQYEVLRDDDVPYNNADTAYPSTAALQLDSTHNLDLFFSQIYEYHQLGGYTVIATRYALSSLKFVFLFFCLVEILVCLKWDQLLDPKANIFTWDDVALSPAVCWASLPAFAALCLILAIFVFAYHLVRSCITLSQLWGVRRFCTIVLDMPTSDSDLGDLTWSEVLRRVLAVQVQMPISRTKDCLDELDIYNRILRQTNYLIGMVNREIIPLRFHVPFISGFYVYLPNYYLLNLKLLLFWGPKCPFASYSQLRMEYKYLSKREDLSNELAKQSRIIGFIGLLLSPVAFLVQFLLFLFSNAQRLRNEPGQLFGRSWSNYARLYLRHFNELPHEFNVRLNQAYLPATQYLECFQSRLLNTVASHLAFTLGGISVSLFLASLFRENLIHLTGYLAAMAIGGLIAKVCVNVLPTNDTAYFPKTKLISTLARIHYMPDSWKENAHTYKVRHEFSQLFQFRIVGALEEILSPFLTPLIMLFCVPKRSLDIVDFLRNFTVDLEGVGDICSFAQLDIPRHGDPEWCPMDDVTPPSPSSRDADSEDGSSGVQNFPAIGGKTELSLMHFHHTNPNWNLPPDSRAFLAAVRRQALNDIQRHQQEQADMLWGIQAATTASLFGSLYATHDVRTTAVASAQQTSDQFYSSDFSTHHIKNVSHLPTTNEQPSFGLSGALLESVMKANPETSNTGTETPGELSPPGLPSRTERPGNSRTPTAASLPAAPVPLALPLFGMNPSVMATSGLCYSQQIPYQPYTSQMDDKIGMNVSYMSPSVAGSLSYGDLTTDMNISSLYIHELHQRRRNQHRLSHTSLIIPPPGSSTLRQLSLNTEGFQDEIRYQQPGHRYLGAAGRGRSHASGPSVSGGLRSARQFVEVVEEEADGEEEAMPQQQTASTTSSTETRTGTSPNIINDGVQKWPNLPPPTC
ncbi:unnamed protein product [Mesocestoides corti]|uniref:Autophagy-related protein 9 n=1 Tax=Mesocestoides corti TaxID=53468 RepID=A0A0R3UFC7_MESCO|nr:unnamed protein product [Mesocestoides corti]